MANRLQHETSPYLLQHKDNPVAWYPWSAEAFEVAQAQQKPIFLSIGYATCYWCHMMEKDSFEHDSVAAALNKEFIAIKVDREERPDVDQIYMDAVTGLTGHGGWPMSVFLTPDKKPFWGGTFVKREQFIQLCERLADIWHKEPEKILASAQSITAALQASNTNPDSTPATHEYLESWKRGCEALLRNFDQTDGGFGPAPKFPPSQQIQSLLSLPDAPETFHHAALVTLEQIGKRGLFDHVEGGFHRYATDAAWEVPHFEKMLYDNALLIPSLLMGYRTSGYEPFLALAKKTADYLFTQLRTAEGLFMSAEDAGDVGKEGAYYCWSVDELAAMPEHLKDLYRNSFQYMTEPNFEEHITLVGTSLSAITSETLAPLYEYFHAARQKRARPACDYKVITGWNGLVLTALCSLYRLTQHEHYLAAATTLAKHFTEFATRPLERLLSKTNRNISATLEDYAYVIEGLIALYQCSFDESWLTLAHALQTQQDSLLWNDSRKLYRSSSASDLLVERFELVDGALPSPNAVALENVTFLSKAFHAHAWFERGTALDASLGAIAHRYPSAMNRYFLARWRYQQEVVAVGGDATAAQQLLTLDPSIALFATPSDQASSLPCCEEKRQAQESTLETAFYHCQAVRCLAPYPSFAVLYDALQQNQLSA